MVNEAPQRRSGERDSGRNTDFSWLLADLVRRVPHATGALLLSADGLTQSAHGLEPDAADQLAALASGLHSLARSFGLRMAGGDGVRQVVVELDHSLLCVSRAGQGTRLAVLAAREADPAVLGYEMTMLIKRVRPFLTAPARQSVQP
ncbi:roadblock/LC7 domain-containing protein [Streptomyces sp. 3N207]|uniref:roadblock/LC7 domain-containing protein n=1 Tax=Streptomyces sp. 3N207 TaxID=3457417 RepID=UPI003FD2CAC3